MQALAIEKDMTPETPQLVFEGNLPAVVDKNPLAQSGPRRADLARRGPSGDGLGRRRDRDQGPDQRRLPPPGRQPRPARRPAGRGGLRHPQHDARQPGHAARRPRPTGDIANGAKFYVFDGSAPDSPNLGMLNKLANVIPHPFKTANYRDFHPLMLEIGEELARRQANDQGEYPRRST